MRRAAAVPASRIASRIWRFTMRNSSASADACPSGSINPALRSDAKSTSTRSPASAIGFAVPSITAGGGADGCAGTGRLASSRAASTDISTGAGAGAGTGAGVASGAGAGAGVPALRSGRARFIGTSSKLRGIGAAPRLLRPNAPLARSRSELFSSSPPSGLGGLMGLCSVIGGSSCDHLTDLNEFDPQQDHQQPRERARTCVEQTHAAILDRLAFGRHDVRDRP